MFTERRTTDTYIQTRRTLTANARPNKTDEEKILVVNAVRYNGGDTG